MRRLFGWMAGLVGHRRARAPAGGAPRAGRGCRRHCRSRRPRADPAEELRRKLAESRDEPRRGGRDARRRRAREPTESLEERRARVHAKAQEAIDAMDDLAGAAHVSEHAAATTSPAPSTRLEEQVDRAARGGAAARRDVRAPRRRRRADALPAVAGSYAWVGVARRLRCAGVRRCPGSCSRASSSPRPRPPPRSPTSTPVAIGGVMVGAWVLVALIEWAASRADRRPELPVYVAAPSRSGARRPGVVQPAGRAHAARGGRPQATTTPRSRACRPASTTPRRRSSSAS